MIGVHHNLKCSAAFVTMYERRNGKKKHYYENNNNTYISNSPLKYLFWTVFINQKNHKYKCKTAWLSYYTIHTMQMESIEIVKKIFFPTRRLIGICHMKSVFIVDDVELQFDCIHWWIHSSIEAIIWNCGFQNVTVDSYWR